MKGSLGWAAVVSLMVLGGCGGGRSTEIRSTEYPVGSRWNGRMATPASMVGVAQVGGVAWMAEADPTSTQAHVEIENATPGGRHPWHVHRGQCGNDQGIVGPADRYEVLEVDGDGEASKSATLPIALPRTGNYMVNVHASPENMGTIISCGNLSPPTR